MIIAVHFHSFSFYVFGIDFVVERFGVFLLLLGWGVVSNAERLISEIIRCDQDGISFKPIHGWNKCDIWLSRATHPISGLRKYTGGGRIISGTMPPSTYDGRLEGRTHSTHFIYSYMSSDYGKGPLR